MNHLKTKLSSLNIADHIDKVSLLIEIYGRDYDRLHCASFNIRLSQLRQELKPKEFITINKMIIRTR